MRINKKFAQEFLGIGSENHIGDIAHLPEWTPQRDAIVKKLVRAGYICLAGDRYLIAAKAL